MDVQRTRRHGESSGMEEEEETEEEDGADSEDDEWPIRPLLDDDDDEKSNACEEGNDDEDLVCWEGDPLERFRLEWREELASSGRGSRAQSPDTGLHLASVSVHRFEKAKTLFLEGVEKEKSGHMHDAIRCYARSVHLVPDIERRLFKKAPTTDSNHNTDRPSVDTDHRPISFQERLVSSEEDDTFRICQKHVPQEASHISDLPLEVLDLIFKWVISSELDMRQLEQLSMVCAGFHLLARGPELWRLACERVWAASSLGGFQSWRHMFLERPHLWHNGVYIAKISYVRHGETSFQDEFYRPWHLVVYYRYLRFFADGTMLMLTSSECPVQVLPFLRRGCSGDRKLVRGRWGLAGPDLVHAHLRCPKKSYNENYLLYPYTRRKKVELSYEPIEHIYNVELRVSSVKRRLHARLAWVRYEVRIRFRSGQESVSEFDLGEDTFPALFFSRVRSFSAQSHLPLT